MHKTENENNFILMEGKEMKKRTISILLAGAMTMAAVMDLL